MGDALMVTRLSFLMLIALTPPSSSVPDLKLPAPLADEREGPRLPPHVFVETLRVPFGDDWGGETYLYTPLGHRLSFGLFMRGWNEAICDRLACAERTLESGVELRYQLRPGVDLGVGLGVQKGAGIRSAPAVLPRIHLKF
jgi:hypothetical protein